MLRGVFAGAGAAMFCELQVVDATLALTKKAAAEVQVLYLGTATYDLPEPRKKQTSCFTERGATVISLDVASVTPSEEDVATALRGADVIIVSGGNTLYAMDRWHAAKVVEPLRRAMERGATLCGGSAGAGCWFDGLHSDSMDPETYRACMLEGKGGGAEGEDASTGKAWPYVRVSGLAFLPGLVCPHHDRVQSNGVLRATDFDGMLARHPGETGLCIDHFAALVIEGDSYAEMVVMFYVTGRPGAFWAVTAAVTAVGTVVGTAMGTAVGTAAVTAVGTVVGTVVGTAVGTAQVRPWARYGHCPRLTQLCPPALHAVGYWPLLAVRYGL